MQFTSLWPSDAMWHHRSWILLHVLCFAWWHLKQCWEQWSVVSTDTKLRMISVTNTQKTINVESTSLNHLHISMVCGDGDGVGSNIKIKHLQQLLWAISNCYHKGIGNNYIILTYSMIHFSIDHKCQRHFLLLLILLSDEVKYTPCCPFSHLSQIYVKYKCHSQRHTIGSYTLCLQSTAIRQVHNVSPYLLTR